jgi:hypothetical protein
MLLVLICLGGMAIDLSVLHAAHRSAHRVISAATDDAAAALDDDALQRTGALRIDPAEAHRLVAAHLAYGGLPGRLAEPPSVRVDPSGQLVTVSVELEVEHVMLRALPTHAGTEQLHVEATARLNR